MLVSSRMQSDSRGMTRLIHGYEGKLTSCRILQGVRDLMAQVGKSVTTGYDEKWRSALCHRSVKGKRVGPNRVRKRLSFNRCNPYPLYRLVSTQLNHPSLRLSPSLTAFSSLYLSLPRTSSFPSFPPLLSHGLHHTISLGLHPFPLCFLPNPRQ